MTVKEANESHETVQWNKATDEEIASHIDNNTWTLKKLPKGRKAIKAKWMFKVKNNGQDEPVRYKARLVAKGCSQKFGVDYIKTVAAVIAHAVQQTMKIYQMDAVTAFLQGDLDEEIYMQQPEGYEDGSELVCKLNKAVYGLKQASR